MSISISLPGEQARIWVFRSRENDGFEIGVPLKDSPNIDFVALEHRSHSSWDANMWVTHLNLYIDYLSEWTQILILITDCRPCRSHIFIPHGTII